MTFTSFLKIAVLACAGSSTLLAALALAGSTETGSDQVIPAAAAWWVLAAGAGAFIGRRNETSPAISRLLRDAPTVGALPDAQPTRLVINRLWPLALLTLGAGAFVLVAPHIAAIAAGFPLIWALGWRHQPKAVQAIEDRDGVRFLIEKTSPLKPIRLVRTPWFKAARGEPQGS